MNSWYCCGESRSFSGMIFKFRAPFAHIRAITVPAISRKELSISVRTTPRLCV